MTYKEAEKLMYENINLVETDGNEKFPYYIGRLLIMPSKRDDENELCIIKWTIGQGVEFKQAFKACELKEEDFDVYVYTKTKNKLTETSIRPILLSEYLSQD